MNRITLSKIRRANPGFFDRSHTAHDTGYAVRDNLFTVKNRDPWGIERVTTYRLNSDCKIHPSLIVED